jgi:polyvinyl alcohol dehydrogenase (cytochrome)
VAAGSGGLPGFAAAKASLIQLDPVLRSRAEPSQAHLFQLIFAGFALSGLMGVEWGAAVDRHNVYVALSDVRTRMAPGAPGAQPSLFGQSYQLDPKAGGGLFALKLETGAVVWHTPHPGCGARPGCSPAQSAAVTAIPGVVFSGGLDGHLRAYSAATGAIIWDVDTEGDYHTVNGLVAHGGSIDGPGPVVVGGMLYVNSGYEFFGAVPGNVLLAFSVDGH